MADCPTQMPPTSLIGRLFHLEKVTILFLIEAFMPAYNRCKQTFSRAISLKPQLLVHGTGNFWQASRCF